MLVSKTEQSAHPAEVLLAPAASADANAKASKRWPERDVVILATFCVTGIRLAEAIGLNLNWITGPPGTRRLQVTAKATRTGRSRSSPRSNRCSTATSNRESSDTAPTPSRTRPPRYSSTTTAHG